MLAVLLPVVAVFLTGDLKYNGEAKAMGAETPAKSAKPAAESAKEESDKK